MNMSKVSRRDFFRRSATLGMTAALAGPLAELCCSADERGKARMRLGLCTYLWGQDWDLPTILANCRKSGVLGVELRTEHKHGVESTSSPRQRTEVKKRFAASPVAFVGMGTNECFDNPDPARLRQSIEAAKKFVRLSHDCGGSGVKVKPNDFHKGVPRERTIEQIGTSLNGLARFAVDFGQQIRLEVHGSCCELTTIREIMDVADHPNVGVCWNSNPQDLLGQGLEYNFNLVKNRLGATTHIRELDSTGYPYRQLIDLLVKANYTGWLLLECSSKPKDRVAVMAAQQALFERMLAAASRGE
jgi:sugar phosphate isomerase/epimerase